MFDAAFKVVFSERLVAELLAKRHLAPRWAERLDYSTLSMRPTEVVAGNFQTRRLDLLWACRAKDARVEALLPLELQGKSDADMATRAMVYGGLAVQQRRKEHRARAGTPTRYRALSLVLFHGDGAWTASKRPVELLGEDAPECYQVVSPLPFGSPEPVLHDLPQLVLGLGRSMTNAQMSVELALLRQAVDLSGDAELDGVVVGAVREVLAFRKYPEHLLKEMDTMHAAVEVFQRSWRETERRGETKGLKKGMKKGMAKGLEKGLEEGLEQGRREGRREGRRRLCRMAARKFNADTARELAGVLDRISDPRRLDAAAEAIIDCDASEAFLRVVRRVATG